MRTDGRADEQTDMTKLIAASRKFGNAPQISCRVNSYLFEQVRQTYFKTREPKHYFGPVRGRMWPDNNKLYTKPPKLLRNFYSIDTIYNVAAGWRPMVYNARF